jgi:uncharacterized DUF497 family protein
MELTFEWDPRKAAANRRKHGVAFEQAIPVFGDSLARIFDDPDQTGSESRELIVGHCTGSFSSWYASSSGATGYGSSVRAAQRAGRGGTMKKASSKRKSPSSGMRSEYRLDYDRARPNRFAERVPANAVAVVLDPDVTAVFGSSDSVNALLRSVVRAIPDHAGRRRKAG